MYSPTLTRNIAVVWSLTILLTAILGGIWYIFQPSFTYTTNVLNTVMQTMNINSTNTNRVVTLLRLAINVTIPIMIGGLWIWAIVSSQKKDPRGYYVD